MTSTPRVSALARSTLLGLVLGLSLLYATVCLAIVLQFGDRDVRADRAVVRNDFVAFLAIARFADRGRPELAYDRDQLLDLERVLSRNPDMALLSAAYPPSFAWLIRPLASLDIVRAYRLWVASTLCAAALVALLIARRWWMPALVPLMPAVAFCAAAGQNGNLSAALLGLGMWLLRKRPVAAGIAFGLLTYKPQLAMALPFCLLAGGHGRAFVSAGVTAVALVAVSLVAFGPAPWFAFLAHLPTQSEQFFGGALADLWPRMPTVMVAVLQSTGDRTTAAAIQAFVAAGVLAALCHTWRRTERMDIRAVALVAAMPLVSPYFFDYDLAVALVPIAFLVGRAAVLQPSWPHPNLMLALWATAPFLTYAPEALHRLAVPAIWGAVLWSATLAARRVGPGGRDPA